MPPTFAARWKTSSAPSRARKQASRSRRSYSAERTTLTSAPSSRSRPLVGVPRKPPPPVTTTFFSDQKPGSGAPEAIGGRLATAPRPGGLEAQRADREPEHPLIVDAVGAGPERGRADRDPALAAT